MDQSNVAITGGTINGTPIGGGTPSTGAFTGLSASVSIAASSASYPTCGVASGGNAFNMTVDASRGYLQTSGNSWPIQVSSRLEIGGTDVVLSRPAANTLALRKDGSAEQTLIVGPNSTGIRSNAGELEAFDNSGNVTTISPHAKDAPEALYEVGPGVDEMDRKANVFLNTVHFWNVTRRKAIDALDLAARLGAPEDSETAWAEVLQRRTDNRLACHHKETGPEYKTRTGKNIVPVGQDEDWWNAATPAERWNKNESDRVAASTAAHAAWQERKDAADMAQTEWENRQASHVGPEPFTEPQPAPFTEPEPAPYVAQPPPAWASQ